MALPLDRGQLLAAVERSPQAAAAHDREGWVGLFTADGSVEDPVGSRPHVGHTQIGHFYDTFIGPRDIKFHRDLDIVFGPVVLRDLVLEVTMGSAVTMHIPAVLRYGLREDLPGGLREANGHWRIAQLRAYWELPAMMLQFLRTGLRAASPALQLSRGLLTNQGLPGTAGFMTGFRRVGARHKRVLQTFLEAAARGDKPTALQRLSSSGPITLGDDDPLDATDLVEQLNGAGCTKMIGAGPTVAVSLNSARGRAIMFVDGTRRGNALNRIRYFPA
ncbi:ketosteroid isomerase family protein [Mycobacterium sp. 852002-51057_SCH5723018]|uniref:ketosteroid isomerase family protein n=1 Tax=Mycobacterium sp. 852002-51057_SCH5723018 TaxID=1834094 RepID=UPI0008019E92|nr:ketosteroid isomerase family protein [Mycobacterium sp. 852002-51057_SCH5723018]OBG24554.1 transporter [Mycobacterium sp. 852002-51057_SCH5723018]